MLFTFLTTLTMCFIEKVNQSYWHSRSIACTKIVTNWILRIFTFDDKIHYISPWFPNFSFFWASKWSRSDPISHKTIWHIPNTKNSEFKLKKNARFFQTLFYFSFMYLDNSSHKFWEQSPSSHYQCCLQVY